MVTPSIPGAVFFSANFKAQVTSSWWIGDKAPQATSFTASGSRLSQAEACLSSGFQKAVKFAKLTAFIPGSLSQSPETISLHARDLFLEYRAWVLAYRALRLAHRFKGKLGLFRDGLGLTDTLQPAIDSVFSCFPLSKLLGRLIWWFPRIDPAWARPPNQLSPFQLARRQLQSANWLNEHCTDLHSPKTSMADRSVGRFPFPSRLLSLSLLLTNFSVGRIPVVLWVPN